MVQNYCTVFDKNYVFQALALAQSLLVHSNKKFNLFMLCMDSESFDMIEKIISYKNLKTLKAVHLDDVYGYHKDLLKHTLKMNKAQNCWTMQPYFIDYCIKNNNLRDITYLEADSFFFSSPDKIHAELYGYSACVVPHNFSPEVDNEVSAGKYCVQFNYFKNDSVGKKILEKWKVDCLKYSAKNPLDYPGQISLNEWPNIDAKVKVIEHLGAGVAPWNMWAKKTLKLKDLVLVNHVEVIFYHFHEFSLLRAKVYFLSSYFITRSTAKLLYAPYIKSVEAAKEWCVEVDPNFIYQRKKNVSTLILIKLWTKSILRSLYSNFNLAYYTMRVTSSNVENH